MVSRQDLRNFNEATQDVQSALDDIKELYEADQQSGVTVDTAAFDAAQTQLKNAINALVHDANDAVDRTDVYEPDEDGATNVSLPQTALSRSNSTSLPKKN